MTGRSAVDAITAEDLETVGNLHIFIWPELQGVLFSVIM